MSRFDIHVTRDGGWWMVHIPKLGGRTQPRYPSEVEPMAREYIAVSTGTPIDQVAINWRRCTRLLNIISVPRLITAAPTLSTSST